MSKIYIKLAATNIKNSRQFYLPYLLTGILTAAMFYTIVSMQKNPGLAASGGGSDVQMILGFGIGVVIVFTAIFLFYTNSFIIKRRKKELGVYNILGMEKRHISKVLFWEIVFTILVAVGGGLLLGVVFNKLLTMLLYRLIGFASGIPFYISIDGIWMTILLFVGIYAMTLLYDFMQIKLSNPVELLHGGNVGEKEPKTKMLMTVFGAICLGTGYFISVTVQNPIDAMSLFFVAVILVILGTYALFTAGSIALLKCLRKNKKYYYKTKHFTTVSGMIYRMKQNAVGLGNICILSTMVLVILSTTVSMYLGVDDELNVRFPNEIQVKVSYDDIPQNTEEVYKYMKEAVEATGRTITYTEGYGHLELAVLHDGAGFVSRWDIADASYDFSKLATVMVLTRQSYQELTNEPIPQMGQGDMAIVGAPYYEQSTVSLMDEEYSVVESRELILSEYEHMMMGGGSYYMVVSDEAEVRRILERARARDQEGWGATQYKFSMAFDIDGTSEEKLACANNLSGAIEQISEKFGGSVYFEARQLSYDSFYRLYGALFFLGIFLGTMFLMVTVLIIFYKQISEGYDDKERFAIMEKVGMSNTEVKSAIRAQIQTVFLLPIVTAAIHVTAAFPIITKMLAMMNLTNKTLFAGCLIGTIVVFAIIYLAVFLLTSRSYYKIVGNQV